MKDNSPLLWEALSPAWQACIVYTTTEPCPLCMGALYMSGVRGLRFTSRDPWAGSANLLGTTQVCGPERVDLLVAHMVGREPISPGGCRFLEAMQTSLRPRCDKISLSILTHPGEHP